MVRRKMTRAVFGITTALVFSTCMMPVMASTVCIGADETTSAGSSDQTYAAGLDLEALIIKTVEQDQRSPYAKTGIAVTDDYLVIRTTPDEKGDAVGKLYSGSGCEIISLENDWTKIKSGDCEGYVKSKYLLSGVDAEIYAAEHNVSEIVAKSQNDNMYLYEEASADSNIVATVMWDQEMTVNSTTDDNQWVQVTVGDKKGFIPADSVLLDVKYEEAVSMNTTVETKEESVPEKETEKETEVETETQTETETEKETEIETEKETEAETQTATETEKSKVSIEEVNEKVWATYSVSIRADYSKDSEKLGVLVGSYSITRTGICDNGWSQVDYNGKKAYIKSEYLTKDEPVAETEKEPEAIKETVYATEGVNVRAKASTDADILGTLLVGNSVTRTGKLDSGWSKVVFNGKTAYVKSDYLTTKKPETTSTSSNQSNEPSVEKVDETVYATAGVNIRAKASAKADVLGTLIAGYSINRTGKLDNGWSQVDYNGKTGYIKSDYLTTKKPETTSTSSNQSNEPSVETVNETVYATAGVNIRAKASADADKISSLATGASITRTGKLSNGWSRVEFSGKTGYIKSDYLTTKKPSVDTSSSNTATSTNSSLGQQIADFAVQYVGYPYVYGGNSLTNGVDCSGFTQQVYLKFGYSIPRRASIQATVGTSVSISNLQPGDLVFYGDSTGVGHVVIYIGDGKVVHASTPSTGIIISDLYYRSPMCAKRII